MKKRKRIKNNKMKKIKIALLSLVSLLILIVLIPILINLISNPYKEPKEFVTNKTFVSDSDIFFKYETSKYPSNAEITSSKNLNESITLGFVVDPWNLNFGIVPSGERNLVKRYIELTNSKNESAKINFKVYGNISPQISFSKNDFILQKNEKISIEVYFHTNDAGIGNYSGEIDVIVKRPKYNFLEKLWS
jgi:hypothetical protein